MTKTTKNTLTYFYENYHKAEFINPDPLIFPKRYYLKEDVEAAAFISASFALGRVSSIINFLEELFSILGNPREGLMQRTDKDIDSDFKTLKYRFYNNLDICHFLKGLRSIYLNYQSIENCFKRGYKMAGRLEYSDIPVVAGLTRIAECVNRQGSARNVVADPRAGSACKRLFLFLRWVVRKDIIDPGGWSALSTSELIIPLDTHIAKISRSLFLTERKSADLKTAIEITEKLKTLDKEDPVKYDFSMSRIGIHPDLSYKDLKSDLAIANSNEEN